MEAVIVFGLSIIPSFSWLLFVRSANEANENAKFQRSFDLFIKRCMLERRRRTKTRITRNHFINFIKANHNTILTKLRKKTIFAREHGNRDFSEMPANVIPKETSRLAFKSSGEKIKTARKEIKAKKSETISMFSCVSRQKLKKDFSAQKPEKQFYSRDRSSERRNRLKMLFVQSPSVFYGHFFFISPGSCKCN